MSLDRLAIVTEPETLPEHIGPYRVTGHLGRGGMGEVLRGHDDRLDRPVALKRIRPGGKDPEKARQRFRREARVVARLSHQTIVQVYDWVEAGGHDWLVMELVDGHSLDDLLAAGPLPPERAVAIARQVASGLAAAHEAGLVHRDLKPANVMVTTGGDHPDRVHPDRVHPDRIKILDFGIAKQVGLDTAGTATEAQPTTLTEAGQVIGTVAYMSPEQALGYPVDHRSDLFSLGTLLYEMLSGVSPFAGDSAVETLSRICSTRETPLRRLDPNVTEDVAGLVGRLLEKEPERRPASAREVAAELDRLAAGSDAARPAATGHDEAGPYDATLEMPASVSEKVARVVEASDTYSIRKVSGRWVLAAAAVPLIVAGLWGLSSWLGPKAEEEPVIDAPAPTARMSDEGGQVFETDYEKGRVLLGRFDQKGNLAQAIEMFGALADRYPDSAAAHASLAQALWRKHWVSLDNRWLEQALPVAKRAVELDPYLASGQVSLGLVSMEIGELDAATEAFESALRLNPASALVHSGLGQLHEARGELENAELATSALSRSGRRPGISTFSSGRSTFSRAASTRQRRPLSGAWRGHRPIPMASPASLACISCKVTMTKPPPSCKKRSRYGLMPCSTRTWATSFSTKVCTNRRSPRFDMPWSWRKGRRIRSCGAISATPCAGLRATKGKPERPTCKVLPCCGKSSQKGRGIPRSRVAWRFTWPGAVAARKLRPPPRRPRARRRSTPALGSGWSWPMNNAANASKHLPPLVRPSPPDIPWLPSSESRNWTGCAPIQASFGSGRHTMISCS